MHEPGSTHMEGGAGVKQPGSAECGTLLDIGQDQPWEMLAIVFSMLQPCNSEN